ncbi:MAG TPA: hypothetical protein VLA12_01925 [Planctomycetaceae bacterium]|nr:hypothetical protein [Planctomycetaceae bacterium]
MPPTVIDRVELQKSTIEDREAARRLVKTLREIINLRENRQDFASFLCRMLGLPEEAVLNNAKIFTEYMFVKLVLESTILEADEPEMQVCDPRMGLHLKELSYQIFAEEYLKEMNNESASQNQGVIDEQRILQYLDSYEQALKNEGLNYLGALFAKRVFKCLDIKKKNFKASHGTMLAMVLATHGVGMYWSSVFSSYQVVSDFDFSLA